MPRDEAPVVACTLTVDAYRDRMQWIQDLNRTALRSHSRDHLRLQLIYDPGAAAMVRKFVRSEQECCAFLAFEVSERPEAVFVTVSAPEEAHDAAEMLFDQFTLGAGEAVDTAAPGEDLRQPLPTQPRQVCDCGPGSCGPS